MNESEEIVPGFCSDTDDTLRLELNRMGGVEAGVVIRMSGYLDGFNVVYFSRCVAKVMDHGFVFLSFDLAGISYISSRGIGAFAGFLKTLRARGGDVHLFGLRPKVLDVFRILGFLEYFHIGRTLQETIDSVKMESASPEFAAFPLRTKCPVCEKPLIAPGPGKGRCPVCKCKMAIDRSGRVSRIP